MAETILAKHSFTFYIEVDTVQDLVVPDEINIITKSQNPKAEIFVVFKDGAQGKLFGKNQLDQLVVNIHINYNNRPEMVYISGPATLYSRVQGPLKRAGVTSDRIFLV